MRVWLDPRKVAERGLSAGDVVRAIREQNVQAAAGVVGASPGLPGVDLQLSINAQGRLQTEEEFADIIVKTDAGRRGHAAARRGAPGARRLRVRAALAARQQARGGGADLRRAQLQRARDLRQRAPTMAEIKKAMPEGVDYEIVYDPTQFVRASIKAVVHDAARGGRCWWCWW